MKEFAKRRSRKSPCYVSAFDLDHTLLSANSSYTLGKFLYQQRYFSFGRMLYLMGCFWLHHVGLISMRSLQQTIFKKLFRFQSKSSFIELAKTFLDQHFQQLHYPPAIRRLRDLQQKGHYIVILSASPDFLVSLIAERLGVHAWEATRYDVDSEGYFKCVSSLMQGEDKANYLARLIKRLGIKPAQVTAYSDSYRDLAFLKAAGCAVGVNPDCTLKRHCLRNNWPIL